MRDDENRIFLNPVHVAGITMTGTGSNWLVQALMSYGGQVVLARCTTQDEARKIFEQYVKELGG